ncbi:MAG: FG-GAP repeat protein [Ignavibacteria bacterium]|nr:FG-GAP repeat protein [Ignavibacteria bacterium]
MRTSSGRSEGDAIQRKIFNGEFGEGFGISVSTAGDVNGDGYSDIIVGAYRYIPEEIYGRYISITED